MPGSTFPVRLVPAVGLVIAVAMTACTAVPGTSAGPDTASPDLTASPVATVSPVATTGSPALTPSPAVTAEPTPEPTVAGVDSPPDALLAAEGGDPVMGRIGTSFWFNPGTGTGSGSDGPWARGAPITVGAGEPLTVSFTPVFEIERWRAVYAPAGVGPENATALGEGATEAAFPAPGVGSWTLAVSITFPAGTGSAHYYWLLDVR